ncbi:hypothetical protein FHL15_007680 [Xylaria flabelliformis]|uniref:Uncharacterized protein n=1 Tax=Xylaria flabelliformis TaxID=2512241 RepID=A0A553HU19_9PEZI|nr:hypothetical protein FHL15_007680 [Xylaria flabelliformis]
MSNPPVPSTNEYSEVIGNRQQTVDLASSIIQLVGQPLNAALARRNAHIALRKGLGEWAGEAFDENNQCQQPVPREDAFVTHLIENQARFHPSGSCKATFAWAKLLYSLDIRPGCNIVEWQPLGTDADPSKSGTIELALEGPVLCHVINLYQIYDRPHGVPLQNLHNRGVTWPFPFGALTIYLEHNGRQGSIAGEITEPGSWTAAFKPYSDKALSAPRQPFLTAFRGRIKWSGRPLAFEANSIAIKYVSTVKHSMCSDGVLGLPDPKDTIQTRCLSLYKCLETLAPSYDKFPNQKSYDDASSKPYLLTPSWIEEASRIKRRVTTNGGADNGLAEYIVEFLSKKPDVVDEMIYTMNIRNNILGRPMDRDWKEAVRQEVKHLSFYQDDTFSFYWSRNVLSAGFAVRDIVIRELPNALNSLSQGSPGTWLSLLSGMAPEVLKVLRCRRFGNCPVLVLELTSEHPLWRISTPFGSSREDGARSVMSNSHLYREMAERTGCAVCQFLVAKLEYHATSAVYQLGSPSHYKSDETDSETKTQQAVGSLFYKTIRMKNEASLPLLNEWSRVNLQDVSLNAGENEYDESDAKGGGAEVFVYEALLDEVFT